MWILYSHLIRQMERAEKELDYYYLYELRFSDELKQLTPQQRDDIIEKVETIMVSFQMKVASGDISLFAFSQKSRAAQNGRLYTRYLHWRLEYLQRSNPTLAAEKAQEVFEDIYNNPYVENIQKWNDDFIRLLVKGV